MVVAAALSIQDRLKLWSGEFERHLADCMNAGSEAPSELVEAMRYSLLAPGKRLRPFLVDRCYRLVGGRGDDAIPLCVAVECLHAFTLIHDDLPAMDDSDARRGQPSSHKAFGEGLAILAGDALLAYGIELASRAPTEPAASLKIVQFLTRAIGWTGVIGGQVVDILSEGKDPELGLVEYIHQRKTARLFQACCCCGAVAGGADEQTFNNLSRYGLHLGLAFQIADDLLDAGEGREFGPGAGPDRQTYPRAAGVAESRRLGEQEVGRAVDALRSFGPQADELRQIARFAMSRDN